MALDEGAVQEVALAEAALRVVDEEVVRHAAAEAFMPAAGIQPLQMVAIGFHVRRPKPTNLER